MRFRMLALALCLCLLSGCGNQLGAVAVTTGGGEDREAPPLEEPDDPEPGDAGRPEAVLEPEPAPEDFFETLPRTYMFCSGAGGWSTDLCLEADGSFTGQYHDADMGVTDPERFPQGTWYICNFSGQFTRPVKIDETTWSMEIASLELEHPDDESEEYADGRRYIYTSPYGLENAEEILIYLPDTPADSLSEDVLWAARGPYNWRATAEGTLGLTILYNVSQGHGFAEYYFQTER